VGESRFMSESEGGEKGDVMQDWGGGGGALRDRVSAFPSEKNCTGVGGAAIPRRGCGKGMGK